MASNEDKLIKNYCLFISLYQTNTIEEKKLNIARCLDDGADVNAEDANNKHNTPLHIAVQKGEKDVIQLLIDRGAIVNRNNLEGKSPLDFANNLIETNNNHTAILELLNKALKTCNNVQVLTSNLEDDVSSAQKKSVKQSKKQKKEFLYPKRAGTSGVCGQLYETKLLSLVLLRALNDNEIEKFHLGTNISGIGALDDICMRFEVKGHSNPIIVFVQAKHREDREKNRLTVEDVCNEAGDFYLPKYFDSYLRIKDSFRPNNEDNLFKGEFNNVECSLIIYTPAKDDFKRKRIEQNELSVRVNDLIQTGQAGDFFQYEHNDDDVIFLTKMTVEDRIKKLGPTFLHFIMAEKDKSETMMTDELIKRYHVVLGREVVQVSDTESNNATVPSTSKDILSDKTCNNNIESKLYHTAKFRPEFFTSKSEFLACLRETFYKEISATRCDKTLVAKGEVLNSIESVLQNPCASTISNIISKIVTFNEKSKKLEIIENNAIKKEFKGNQLNQIKQSLANMTITAETIREAVKIKLESTEFKLPISFGNLDMTIRGSGAKVSKRLDEVADKIFAKLLKPCTNSKSAKNNNVIEIEINDQLVGPGEDQITQGFMDINGGIGGAVGNVLIQDEVTKMIKFDTINKLSPKANEFIKKMTDRIGKQELEKYRIRININGFPKYSFDGDEYDKRQAKDFLNKLWFYTNQAKEDEVESILKTEINKHYNNERGNNQFVFRIHSDAVYLRSHDEIQKWWMQPGKAPYLSKASEFFEQAKKEVVDSPLLTLLNLMYINKVKKLNVEFSEAAISALLLNNNPEGLLNVVTESNVLSGIKIMQYFQNYGNYTFIDFKYVLSLPLNDYNTMIGELLRTKLQNLVIMYDTQKYYEGLCNKLKQVITIFGGSRIVIVTDSTLADEIKEEYINNEYQSVHDNNTYLLDLNEDSQNKMLKEARVVFQGEEVPFSKIIDQETRSLIRTEILNMLLNGEKIEIGHTILDQTYKDVKDYYIARYLTRGDTIQVNTLNDINDKTVVVSATSGMGKSSLLSHLSLNIKLIDPLPWLVRINLPDHDREFRRWQEEENKIDDITVVKFISNVALKNNELQIDLELSEDNEIILANADGITNPVALLELELFIRLYNDDKIIFLFDDFNAICPHYEKEVIEVLNVLKNCGKRMWITTCSYRHTKFALEREFGTPYTLEPLNTEGKKNFLTRFFSTNLRLEKLNYDQFENIHSFMKYVTTSLRLNNEPHREMVPVLSLLFHYVYIAAADFFKSEINHVSPSILNEKMKEEFDIDFNQYSAVDTILGRTPDDEELELAGTPLHIYMAANYFKCRIEDCLAFKLDENECRNKWDLILNTFTLYKHFIEDEMRRILLKDYDVGDSEDNNIVSFGSNRRQFLNKHKKLGLFTICRENDLTKLLKEEEIIEIKDTIARIETGEEKSCLIDCVVNDVPRFGHLIFAEYFAMEGIAEMLKQLNRDAAENPLKNASLWHSVLNIFLFKAPPGIRSAFNYKLQSDEDFAELANSYECKKVLFEILLKENRTNQSTAGTSLDTPIGEALQDRLFNIVNLFLSTAQCNLNRGNVDEVFDLIKRSHLIFSNFRSEYKGVLENVMESLKDLDAGKLSQIIKSGSLTEVPLRHANEYCSSPAVNDLTRRVASTTEQLPAIVQNIQQLCVGASGVGSALGDAIVTVAERGVQTYLDDFMNRMREAKRN